MLIRPDRAKHSTPLDQAVIINALKAAGVMD
jgi:hypothetical protein